MKSGGLTKKETCDMQVGIHNKCKVDGTTKRYKARPLAKGYTKTCGINYQKTSAPVVKMNTVHFLLFLAIKFYWQLH